MQKLLQSIPKVDTLLTHNELVDYEKSLLLPLITSHLQSLRFGLKNHTLSKEAFKHSLANLIPTLKDKIKQLSNPTLKNVINATGIVIHTNLGRSVFSKEILDEITPFLCSYHTLEYDLKQGRRSERYKHCTQLISEICGCEDVLLVNNNAAAVFLILNTFGAHKEVIISRSELIEIGGGFRIPEIMASASCILREVGTSNKTYIQDYENAINEQSAIIMKAHQSNFKQIGFIQSCHIKDIIALARKYKLIDYFDLGSGHMGIIKLKDEPSVQEINAYKPSLISFSGDKLLGAGQVGIICGTRALISKLKKNPILRTLRVDKFSILVLNATLNAYKQKAYHKIPTLSMLMKNPANLEQEAIALKDSICASSIASEFEVEVLALNSLAGGGSIPHLNFKSFGIALLCKSMPIDIFEAKVRNLGLIACIKKNKLLLDMRTLLEQDKERILSILTQSLQKFENDK